VERRWLHKAGWAVTETVEAGTGTLAQLSPGETAEGPVAGNSLIGRYLWLAISYKRAALMQVPLALIGLVTSVTAWLLRGGAWWLVAGLLLGATVPFTLIVIMPTNHKLLATNRDPASTETRALLARWGKLHAIRTVLSLLATALMLRQLCTAI
jgi:uncharacterized membrane protein